MVVSRRFVGEGGWSMTNPMLTIARDIHYVGNKSMLDHIKAKSLTIFRTQQSFVPTFTYSTF